MLQTHAEGPRSNAVAADARKRSLSVVIPILNETRGLPALEQRLRGVLDSLGRTWEVVFVDDGSTDGTLEALRQLHAGDTRYKAISLSRNFGKEIAVAAGAALRDGRRRDRHGRRPAASPRARSRLRREMGCRVRHRLRAAPEPGHGCSPAPMVGAGFSIASSAWPRERSCRMAPAISGYSTARLSMSSTAWASGRASTRASYAWIGFRSIGIPLRGGGTRDGRPDGGRGSFCALRSTDLLLHDASAADLVVCRAARSALRPSSTRPSS